MKLKPHQIGIVIALVVAAAVSVLWVSGGLAGLAINGQKPDTEAIAQ